MSVGEGSKRESGIDYRSLLLLLVTMMMMIVAMIMMIAMVMMIEPSIDSL